MSNYGVGIYGTGTYGGNNYQYKVYGYGAGAYGWGTYENLNPDGIDVSIFYDPKTNATRGLIYENTVDNIGLTVPYGFLVGIPSPNISLWIPERFLKSWYNQEWDDRNGTLLKPNIIAANDDLEEKWRFNLQYKDQIVIRQMNTIDRRLSDDINYKISTTDMRIELYTIVDRQKLYNLLSEIRRMTLKGRIKAVVGSNIYIPDAWNLMEYKSFTETTMTTFRNWQGFCQISLEIYGQRLP